MQEYSIKLIQELFDKGELNSVDLVQEYLDRIKEFDPKTNDLIELSLSFAEFFMIIFFPLLLVYHNYSKGTLGEIIFSATLFLLWLKPYLGGVSDRFGYRIPVLVGLSLIAVLYMTTPLISGLIMLIIYYFIIYVLIYISYPSINSATAFNSPVKQRGLL